MVACAFLCGFASALVQCHCLLVVCFAVLLGESNAVAAIARVTKRDTIPGGFVNIGFPPLCWAFATLGMQQPCELSDIFHRNLILISV